MCSYFKDLSTCTASNKGPDYAEFRKLPQMALDYVRKELNGRGYFGIAALRNKFQRADKNGNGSLERQEFVWCLKEYGINLTNQDYEKVFRYFDTNCDNTISFPEFISALRKDLSPAREEIVKKAYDVVKGGNE